MSLLITILVLLLLLLLLQQAATRRAIRQLLEASSGGKPLLLDRKPAFPGGAQLQELVKAHNRLLQENLAMTNSGDRQFEQIQTTLANLREAVVMIDGDKRIQMANEAFKNLAGEGVEPLGKRLDLFIAGPRFQEFLGRIQDSPEGNRMELETLMGGKQRWLDVSVARLPEKMYSENRYILLVLHDVTRQKNLEKMRTDFVANVSHELRTPVTVIKGFAETLGEDYDVLTDEEKRRFLDKIHTHAKRLDSLLRDLLLLSRLESTQSELEMENMSLSSFIGSQVDTWESILEESGAKLEMDHSVGNDRIQADPLRLTQVVTNLLQNAVLHAKGFTRVRLVTAYEPENVILTVEDDGPGIPANDLPYIFQRFYRVEKGRSRESGGTGLGLAIVKHIVAQHGGSIIARTPEGGGAAIEIRFPRSERD